MKKVVCAMSGGVDSSVAAALLKRQGFEVIGIFMKLGVPEGIGVENRCCDLDSFEMARKTASKLKIPFYAVDLSKEFRKNVIDYYIKEYRNARTPNPCVACNKIIKFDLLLKKAISLGADFLATGHYARIAREVKTKNLKLKTAKDRTKDQTYFLWTLTQNQLKHLLFPIGNYTKGEVRKMAKKWDLPTSSRNESQGACFIGYWTNIQFLSKFIKAEPGLILDLKGNVLGKHRGLSLYTIGQRKGIEVETKSPFTLPYYVIKMDSRRNNLIVGRKKDLYKKELGVEKVNWIAGHHSKSLEVKAKIRYGHPAAPCRLLFIANRRLKANFKKPVWAITPGQSIVFYSSRAKSRNKDNEVLGGGIIA